MIYYTRYEGDLLRELGNFKHQKITKQLFKNRRCFVGLKPTISTGCDNPLYSHSYSRLFGMKVHSVFFTRNGKAIRIWDASINGYRKHRMADYSDLIQAVRERYNPQPKATDYSINNRI